MRLSNVVAYKSPSSTALEWHAIPLSLRGTGGRNDINVHVHLLLPSIRAHYDIEGLWACGDLFDEHTRAEVARAPSDDQLGVDVGTGTGMAAKDRRVLGADVHNPLAELWAELTAGMTSGVRKGQEPLTRFNAKFKPRTQPSN